MDLWEMEVAPKVKVLYKEKNPTFADLLKHKLIDLSILPLQTMRGDFPSIRIPEAGFLRGVERYKYSLIGRLDLLKVKLVVARSEALRKWNLLGNCQFIPLGKGYFTILLDNEADKMRIWGGGPWLIEDQLLRVNIWTPDFDINKQKNAHAMVDNSTLCRNIGFYASVLVDVDFSKTIPSKIMTEREGFEFCQEIQLGKTPKICSYCKVVGHMVSEYRDVVKKIEQEKVIQKEADKEPKKKRRNRKKPSKKDVEDHNKDPETHLNEDKLKEPVVDTSHEPISVHKTYKGVVEMWDSTIRLWDGSNNSKEVDKEASLVNKSWADMVEVGDSTHQNAEGANVEDCSENAEEWSNDMSRKNIRLNKSKASSKPATKQQIRRQTNRRLRYRFYTGIVEVVKENWEQDLDGAPLFRLGSKLRRLKNKLKEWNRVLKLDNDIANDNLAGEVTAANYLLKKAYSNDEELWRQKAKVDWL
ncbi:hypothetical protein GIB67_000839 [Kingdonia uniflora]|uniref:DUF4283 domain-containing protein n=1 Tax=Kingdonia uniflora TaxID=39325 RepID=A0A7J7NQV6_9MAGN|nr:hypothetical protein GIB67_000839 [Kingdonia uniflora]